MARERLIELCHQWVANCISRIRHKNAERIFSVNLCMTFFAVYNFFHRVRHSSEWD